MALAVWKKAGKLILVKNRERSPVVQPRAMSRLTAEHLRKVLAYDPETGNWRWLVKSARAKIGALAGCISGGYRIITIDKVAYRSARLAFLYMTGEWPQHEADHDNRIRSDDRWENLKDRTSAEQKHNRGRRRGNSSGAAGVGFHKTTGKWRARVMVKGVSRCAYRDTKEEAIAARDQMRLEMGLIAAIDQPDIFSDGSIPAAPLDEMIAENQLVICDCCRVPVEAVDGKPPQLVVDADPASGEKNLVCRDCKRVIEFARRYPDTQAVLGAVDLFMGRLRDLPAPPSSGDVVPLRKESA